jgi:hypothetical protein
MMEFCRADRMSSHKQGQLNLKISQYIPPIGINPAQIEHQYCYQSEARSCNEIIVQKLANWARGAQEFSTVSSWLFVSVDVASRNNEHTTFGPIIPDQSLRYTASAAGAIPGENGRPLRVVILALPQWHCEQHRP